MSPMTMQDSQRVAHAPLPEGLAKYLAARGVHASCAAGKDDRDVLGLRVCSAPEVCMIRVGIASGSFVW